MTDGYEYVLVLAVAAVVLALLGPGAGSIDHALRIELSGAVPGLAVPVAGLAGSALLLASSWRPNREQRS